MNLSMLASYQCGPCAFFLRLDWKRRVRPALPANTLVLCVDGTRIMGRAQDNYFSNFTLSKLRVEDDYEPDRGKVPERKGGTVRSLVRLGPARSVSTCKLRGNLLSF